jgi:hypothetical protein
MIFQSHNLFREKKYGTHMPIWIPMIGKGVTFRCRVGHGGGVTDGSNNTFDKVWSRYHDLGYDVIGISDYQKINTLAQDSSGFIPIYEHGYNFRKTHQVNIGAREVLWLDFPFYQTTSHKQFLINLQLPKTEVIALVHPAFSLEGYSHEDFRKLTSYDLLEALNMQIYSISHWDAALSAGRIAYILADDDVHDIDDPFWYGRVATIINAKSSSQEDILGALVAGNAYGFSPYTPDFDTHEKKTKRFKNLPVLQKVEVEGNTLKVVADSGVYKISFYGQNGELRKEVENQNHANYTLTPEDTYIRTVIDYDRDQVMYLNPVFRYSGDAPKKVAPATINWTKSILFNLLAWVIFLSLVILIWKKWS